MPSNTPTPEKNNNKSTPTTFPTLTDTSQKLEERNGESHQHTPADLPAELTLKQQTDNSKLGLAAKFRSNVHHVLNIMHPTGHGKTSGSAERPALAISAPMPLQPRRVNSHVDDHDRHASPKAENPALVALRDGGRLGNTRPRAESMKLGNGSRGDAHQGILKRQRVQSTKSCYRVRFEART